MPYLIPAEGAHRTIARLFGSYDVVVGDLPLHAARDDAAGLRFVPSDLPDLVQGIGNTAGLNPTRLDLSESLSEDTGDLSLHVLDGYHALTGDERLKASATIRYYHTLRGRPSQRLLVTTDSIFVTEAAMDWRDHPRVAVVHVLGL